MQNQAGKICGWMLAVVYSASVASSKPADAQNAPTVVTNPHYVSIALEITVNRRKPTHAAPL